MGKLEALFAAAVLGIIGLLVWATFLLCGVVSQMTVPTIVIGGWFFLFLVMATAVAWVVSVETKRFWPGYTTLGVALLLLQLFGSTGPIGWMWQHWIITLLSLPAFAGIGLGWSLFKFSGVIKKHKADRDAFVRAWLDSRGYKFTITLDIPTELEAEWQDTLASAHWLRKPSPAEYKNQIIIWSAYWPTSMLSAFCRDFVRGVFAELYNRTTHLYQKVIDQLWTEAI